MGFWGFFLPVFFLPSSFSSCSNNDESQDLVEKEWLSDSSGLNHSHSAEEFSAPSLPGILLPLREQRGAVPALAVLWAHLAGILSKRELNTPNFWAFCPLLDHAASHSSGKELSFYSILKASFPLSRRDSPTNPGIQQLVPRAKLGNRDAAAGFLGFPSAWMFWGTSEERKEKNSGVQLIYSISCLDACPYTEFCLSAVATSSPHIIHTQDTLDCQESTFSWWSAQPSQGGSSSKLKQRLTPVIPEQTGFK